MDVWTYELFHRTQMNLMFIICNGFSLCTEQLVAYLISYKQFSACTIFTKAVYWASEKKLLDVLYLQLSLAFTMVI